jgi:uncharacterized OB-fold protein
MFAVVGNGDFVGGRGIAAVSAYVPGFGLEEGLRAQIGADPDKRFGGPDEDALTMSWEALERLPKSQSDQSVVMALPPDGLEPRALLAHLQATGALSPCSSLVAMHDQADVCDVVNVAAALGEGTLAIMVDRDRVSSPLAVPTGDSALALVIGEPVIAELTAHVSLPGLTFDRWNESDERMDRDVRFIEERLAAHEGLDVVTQLRAASTSAHEGFLGVVCTAPAALNPGRLARHWDVPRVWLAAPSATNPGSGRSGTFLTALLALAEGGPGSQVILLQMGWGATGTLLTAGPRIAQVAQGLRTSNAVTSLYDYRSWNLAHQAPYAANPWTSASEMSREAGHLMGLIGSECQDCSAVLFPAAGVCEHCGSFNLVSRALQRRGTVLTHSIDELYAAPAPAIQMVVVSLEEGGQFYGQAAQSVSSWFEIGETCRLVLRRLHTGAGLPHYYWKVERDVPSDVN